MGVLVLLFSGAYACWSWWVGGGGKAFVKAMLFLIGMGVALIGYGLAKLFL